MYFSDSEDFSQNCHHWSAGQAINFAQQDRRKNASKCIIMVILIVARQIPIVLVGLRYRPSFGHGLQLSPVHSTACTEVCGLTKKCWCNVFIVLIPTFPNLHHTTFVNTTNKKLGIYIFEHIV